MGQRLRTVRLSAVAPMKPALWTVSQPKSEFSDMSDNMRDKQNSTKLQTKAKQGSEVGKGSWPCRRGW